MVDKNERKSRKSFLLRLRSDAAGNTIAMMGAALLPLTAMIGGGVDASRGYMVKARLQQACDAGVLAGRKAVGDGVFDQQANDRAIALFNANFPANYQSTTGTSFVASSPNAGGLVEGVASTTLPTAVMKVFGYDNITLSAECNALLTISNADVTMVLDTTGSMSRNIDDGNGGTTTRIIALRGAMANFYDILATASASSQARIRYGLMPYSMTVNVGRLLAADTSGTDMLIGQSGGDRVAYQSRRAVYEIEEFTNPIFYTQKFAEDDTDPALFTSDNCDKFSNNEEFFYYRVPRNNTSQTTTPARSSNSNHTQNYDDGPNPEIDGNFRITYSLQDWDGRNRTVQSNAVRECTRLLKVETRSVTETYDGTLPGATFARWEWGQYNWPVSDYLASIDGGTDVPIPSREEGNGGRAGWAGCIEERQTVASSAIAYDGSTGAITPSGAIDLDIDRAPNDDASRWRPYWPEVSHRRNNNSTTGDACPRPAQLLSTMTRAEFVTYANNLDTDGNTYHDVGLLWGARISSETGIFQTSVNEAAPNNGFVSRHLIFMTDGALEPTSSGYSIYGLEEEDDRIRPGGNGSLVDRHAERMRAICSAIRAKGIRLWVVAFSTSLTTDLQNCASPNSAFVSTNAAQLNQNFAEIAASIADLRLTE